MNADKRKSKKFIVFNLAFIGVYLRPDLFRTSGPIQLQ